MKSFKIFCTLFLLTTTAHAHSNHHKLTNVTVKSCPCDSACYTAEISNLKCDDKFAQFDSKGLPHSSHSMMKGITRSNQQFPLAQPYNAANNNSFRIILNPKFASNPTMTNAGAIGFAVNGVPIFDPRTQNERHDVHTLDVGELDECGGHAGRGDDYHYHVAPKCLIEQLGKDKIENQKLPIGYAKDGYSIHALGWFDLKNNIEEKLDECRGIFDASGKYFYNVKTQRKWDILNCFSGEPKETGPHGSVLRRDKNGNALSGEQGFKGMIPIQFKIENYYSKNFANETCYFASGEINEQNLLTKNGSVIQNYRENGTIFYCNPKCYAHFFESEERRPGGRMIKYETILNQCPSGLNLGGLELFGD